MQPCPPWSLCPLQMPYVCCAAWQGAHLRTDPLPDQVLPAKAALGDALSAHCDMSTLTFTRCCPPRLCSGLPQVPADLFNLARIGSCKPGCTVGYPECPP